MKQHDCDKCNESAVYRHDMPTPTLPYSKNWRGKVQANSKFYCEVHGIEVESKALPGSIRRL